MHLHFTRIIEYYRTVTDVEDMIKTAWSNLPRFCYLCMHHYENMPIQIYWKISPPKTESFQIKIPIFFYISAQSIDCGYSLELPCKGSSKEYLQPMFLSRKMKISIPL